LSRPDSFFEVKKLVKLLFPGSQSPVGGFLFFNLPIFDHSAAADDDVSLVSCSVTLSNGRVKAEQNLNVPAGKGPALSFSPLRSMFSVLSEGLRGPFTSLVFCPSNETRGV